MSINNIPATSQTPALTPEFAFTLNHSMVEHTEVFDTSTGHSIIVKTVHGTAFSRVNVEVINEEAYVVAMNSFFNDFNHLNSCENCLAEYMNSQALVDICEHFDELCTSYDDDEE